MVALALPVASSAQTLRPSVTLGSGLVPVTRVASEGALLFAPRLELVTRGLAFRADGRFAWSAPAGPNADLDATAVFDDAYAGHFRFSGDVSGRAIRFAEGRTLGYALARGRAELWSGDIGWFATLGAGRAANGVSSGGIMRAGAGARFRRDRATFEVAVTSTRHAARLALDDASTVIDTTFVNRQRRLGANVYTRADVRFGWRGPDWRLSFDAGGRLDDALRSHGLWANAHAQKRVAPGIDVLATAGRTPSYPELRLASRPVASLSLRFAPDREAAASLAPSDNAAITRVLTLNGARRRIRIPHEDAQRVEIMADFTDWKPVDLRRDSDGWWVLEMEIAPGRYTMNVRYDRGPWRVPPGLAPVRDEFDGWTGALLIE